MIAKGKRKVQVSHREQYSQGLMPFSLHKKRCLVGGRSPSLKHASYVELHSTSHTIVERRLRAPSSVRRRWPLLLVAVGGSRPRAVSVLSSKWQFFGFTSAGIPSQPLVVSADSGQHFAMVSVFQVAALRCFFCKPRVQPLVVSANPAQDLTTGLTEHKLCFSDIWVRAPSAGRLPAHPHP